MKPRIAVGYARVSDEDKQDTAQMLRTIERYCEVRGWPLHSKHWDKITGDPHRRRGDPPGLRSAIEDVARLGGVGVIVVTDATRLVRSPIELLQLVERIQNLPAAVVDIDSGGDLDTTNQNGELILFLKGFFGRWHLRFIRAQTTRVLDDRKRLIEEKGGFVATKSGKWRTRLGRPSVESKVVEDMRAAWVSGESAGATARRLGQVASTVRMYFGRFRAQAEAMRKGPDNAVDKTAENQQQEGNQHG